jgi:hypothetical protein
MDYKWNSYEHNYAIITMCSQNLKCYRILISYRAQDREKVLMFGSEQYVHDEVFRGGCKDYWPYPLLMCCHANTEGRYYLIKDLCCRSLSMLHVNIPCPGPCCMSISLVLVHAACQYPLSRSVLHVNIPCPCPCCMSISLVLVHAACQYPLSMSVLNVNIPCPCCMSISLVLVHAVCQYPLSRFVLYCGRQLRKMYNLRLSYFNRI